MGGKPDIFGNESLGHQPKLHHESMYARLGRRLFQRPGRYPSPSHSSQWFGLHPGYPQGCQLDLPLGAEVLAATGLGKTVQMETDSPVRLSGPVQITVETVSIFVSPLAFVTDTFWPTVGLPATRIPQLPSRSLV